MHVPFGFIDLFDGTVDCGEGNPGPPGFERHWLAVELIDEKWFIIVCDRPYDVIQLAIANEDAGLLGVAIVKIDVVKFLPITAVFCVQEKNVFKRDSFACTTVIAFA